MAIDRSSYSITGAEMEKVLRKGAETVQDAVRGIIKCQAAHATGRLESAITFELHPESGQAIMGWEKAPIMDKKGRKKTSTYVDRSGRRRKVTTVADYGRILEYSQRRQLRHMEEGRDLAEGKALSVMEAMCDELLDKAVEAQMSKAGL